jgi:hypothetical protein
MTIIFSLEVRNEDERRNSDPCWDIEETEGFGGHKEKLFIFRLKKELEWAKQRSNGSRRFR